MAEQFKMDNAYRDSEEYKEFINYIKKDAPWLPQALAEYCIIAHKQDAQAYKKDKQSKKVLSTPLKPPKNAGEVCVGDAIKVGELTNDIIKQREEFEAKYMPKEELTTIQEVEA